MGWGTRSYFTHHHLSYLKDNFLTERYISRSLLNGVEVDETVGETLANIFDKCLKPQNTGHLEYYWLSLPELKDLWQSLPSTANWVYRIIFLANINSTTTFYTTVRVTWRVRCPLIWDLIIPFLSPTSLFLLFCAGTKCEHFICSYLFCDGILSTVCFGLVPNENIPFALICFVPIYQMPNVICFGLVPNENFPFALICFVLYTKHHLFWFGTKWTYSISSQLFWPSGGQKQMPFVLFWYQTKWGQITFAFIWYQMNTR